MRATLGMVLILASVLPAAAPDASFGRSVPRARVAAKAGRSASQTGDLSGLLHATPDAARRRLGPPDFERAEGRGAFWTYRTPACALYLFFRDEGGLKVSGAAAGPRRRGLSSPKFEACLSELETRRGG